ncbi:uncharacterized protein TNCV_1133191 [Trichonephila clavipes]|nr:uncharacterized protein TNCV_1133191 [Trichonephila clavipes]
MDLRFLKSRVIRVKYNKSFSKDLKLSQGVPQGSVLSPTLFSMFLAGVEKLITEKILQQLLSYGDQHRTSQYLKHWKDNQRLKRNSPFSQALALNLSFNVEHHCLTSFINPVLDSMRVTFHYNLMPNVNKMSDQPELLKQLALEHQQEHSSPFYTAFGRHPIHLQWIPSHVGLFGNEVAVDFAKAVTSNPVDTDHMVLTSTEIYSRAKELVCRTSVVPPVHPCTFCNAWGFPVRRLLLPPAVLRLCTDLLTHGSGQVKLDQMGISPTTIPFFIQILFLFS